MPHGAATMTAPHPYQPLHPPSPFLKETMRNDTPQQSLEGRVTAAVALFALFTCAAYVIGSGLDLEVPLLNYQTTDAGQIQAVTFHHGFGTRTEIRTTTDFLLLSQAAHVVVGEAVVLQRNDWDERLCVKNTKRCWQVADK